MTCNCGNPDYGFDCVCEWVASHPGDRVYECEYCGNYRANMPRCNRCEDLTDSLEEIEVL